MDVRNVWRTDARVRGTEESTPDEPASAIRAYSLVPKAPSKGACSQLCGCDGLGVWPRCASGASKLRFVTFVSTRLEVLTRASVSTFGFNGSHRASRSASAVPEMAAVRRSALKERSAITALSESCTKRCSNVTGGATRLSRACLSASRGAAISPSGVCTSTTCRVTLQRPLNGGGKAMSGGP